MVNFKHQAVEGKRIVVFGGRSQSAPIVTLMLGSLEPTPRGVTFRLLLAIPIRTPDLSRAICVYLGDQTVGVCNALC